MPDVTRLEVSHADVGARVDRYLARELALSLRYARRLLERGSVQLGTANASKGALLRAGDVVCVSPFRHPSEGIRLATRSSLEILAQTERFVALNKPAGVPTHPLDYDACDTLANAIAAEFPETREVGFGPLEPGLVHRLDTETSGVVLVARSQAAWRDARREFEQRSARKLYLARVHGRLETPLELELRLASRGPRVRVVARGGHLSHTLVLPRDVRERDSLVCVDLRTGVRHQIRAVLAHLGHPIVGDRLYGSSIRAPRHLLHAWQLQITDLRAVAPAPAAFDETSPLD